MVLCTRSNNTWPLTRVCNHCILSFWGTACSLTLMLSRSAWGRSGTRPVAVLASSCCSCTIVQKSLLIIWLANLEIVCTLSVSVGRTICIHQYTGGSKHACRHTNSCDGCQVCIDSVTLCWPCIVIIHNHGCPLTPSHTSVHVSLCMHRMHVFSVLSQAINIAV